MWVVWGSTFPGGEREKTSFTQAKIIAEQAELHLMSKSTNHTESEIHWFAMWVYRGQVSPIITLCRESNISTYRPMRIAEYFTEQGLEYREEAIVANLLFVRSSVECLQEIKRETKNRCTAYCYPGTCIPAPIEDKDMEMFMLVTKRGANRLEQVEFPIDKGDKVRVTDGIFKGAEGYIRRVHGSRRFVVAIEGVVAVAVTHIPRQFLEPVCVTSRDTNPDTSEHI